MHSAWQHGRLGQVAVLRVFSVVRQRGGNRNVLFARRGSKLSGRWQERGHHNPLRQMDK